MSVLYATLDYLNPYVERLTVNIKPTNRIKIFMYLSHIWEACGRGMIQEESFIRAHNRQKRYYPKDKLVEIMSPTKNVYVRIFHIVSTLTHLVMISWTVVMLSLSQSNPRRRWLRCHMPQFVFYEAIEQEYMILFACLFGSITLIWRASTYYDFDLKLYGMHFLMVDTSLIAAESDPRLPLMNYLNGQQPSLIQEIIFYKIEDRINHRVYFRLRPNRTLEARAILNELSKWGIFIISCILFLAAISLVPVAAWTVILNQHALYKGCETSDQLYWYRLLVCAHFTLILFLDNAIAIVVPTASGVFVIFDLLLSWRAVELKMNRITRLIVDIRFSHQLYDELDPLRAEHKQRNLTHMITGEKMAVDLKPRDLRLLLMEKEEVEEKVCELQSLMGDFFVQLHLADRFMSRLLTCGAILWLAINAFVTMIGLQTESTSVLIVRIAQLFGLFSLAVMSSLAFWIKQNTEPAYQRINFLMAMDMSSDKLRWKVLLKYYTVNARHGFTLANSILYTQIIFFKIITYTFSFFTFINNFRNLAK